MLVSTKTVLPETVGAMYPACRGLVIGSVSRGDSVGSIDTNETRPITLELNTTRDLCRARHICLYGDPRAPGREEKETLTPERHRISEYY